MAVKPNIISRIVGAAVGAVVGVALPILSIPYFFLSNVYHNVVVNRHWLIGLPMAAFGTVVVGIRRALALPFSMFRFIKYGWKDGLLSVLKSPWTVYLDQKLHEASYDVYFGRLGLPNRAAAPPANNENYEQGDEELMRITSATDHLRQRLIFERNNFPNSSSNNGHLQELIPNLLFTNLPIFLVQDNVLILNPDLVDFLRDLNAEDLPREIDETNEYNNQLKKIIENTGSTQDLVDLLSNEEIEKANEIMIKNPALTEGDWKAFKAAFLEYEGIKCPLSWSSLSELKEPITITYPNGRVCLYEKKDLLNHVDESSKRGIKAFDLELGIHGGEIPNNPECFSAGITSSVIKELLRVIRAVLSRETDELDWKRKSGSPQLPSAAGLYSINRNPEQKDVPEVPVKQSTKRR